MKAYKLTHNVDHFKSNQDYDIWHDIKDRGEKFDDKFLRLEPFGELPLHKFEGKIEKRLSWLDYPCEKFGYPIMSKKMISTLLSVGQFNHEIKPLTIYDWKSEKTTDNFVFLHLLEWKDIIDRENCICYPETGRIKKYALKEPRSGYPPLFRVKGAGLKWFVSEEAKEALEEADIKGLRFVPLIYPESQITTPEPKTVKSSTIQPSNFDDDLSNFKPYVYPPKPDHIIPTGIEGLLTVYFAKDYDELVQQYGFRRLISNIVAKYKEDQHPAAVKVCLDEVSSLVAHEHDETYLRDKIVNEYGVKITISKLGGSYQVFLERLHEELVGKRLYT